MSRPQPKYYHLVNCSIFYRPDHLCEDGSMMKRGYYRASIEWDTQMPQKGKSETSNVEYETKTTQSLNEAIDWIEKEAGIKL